MTSRDPQLTVMAIPMLVKQSHAVPMKFAPRFISISFRYRYMSKFFYPIEEVAMDKSTPSGSDLAAHFNKLKSERQEAKVNAYKRKLGSNLPLSDLCVRILGTGALGTSKSLLIQTQHTEYLFNCGEGTLRQYQENGGRIAKLEHIFITQNKWDCLGGLFDISINLEISQGKNPKELFLHGQPGLDQLLNNKARRFASQHGKNGVMWPVGEIFSDHVMSVENIALRDDSDNTTCAHAFSIKLVPPKRKVDRSKIIPLGIKMGAWVQELVDGADSVDVGGNRIVRAEEVLLPAEPAGSFAVVDCPSEGYLKSLKSSSINGGDKPDVMLHLTTNTVLNSDPYQKWMTEFPNTTKHIIVNEENEGVALPKAWTQQVQLNMINQQMFPLLHPQPKPERRELDGLHDPSANVWYGYAGSTYYHRPTSKRGLCHINVPNMSKDSGYKLFKDLSNVETTVAHREDQTNKTDKRDYPVVSFLGTGASVVTKTRNVTGILVEISETSCILFDCGDGTYGQMFRLNGAEKIQSKLERLKAIFISHGHPDHHLGILAILQARKEVFASMSKKLPTLYLLAPRKLGFWFHHLEQSFPGSFENVVFIPTGWMANKVFPDNPIPRSENAGPFVDPPTLTVSGHREMMKLLDLKAARSVEVKHAYAVNCYGYSITHSTGWKIVFSGDTMPCNALINEAKACDLLIHEATFGDSDQAHAKLKTHSTTGQALDVAAASKAKFTLLTHFSSKHPRIPEYSQRLMDTTNVGITWDNLVVRLRDLPNLTLASLWGVLSKMYPEHASPSIIAKKKIAAMKDQGLDPATITKQLNEHTTYYLKQEEAIDKLAKNADRIDNQQLTASEASDEPLAEGQNSLDTAYHENETITVRRTRSIDIEDNDPSDSVVEKKARLL